MHGCACSLSPLCVGYGVLLIADPQFGGDEDVCELRVVILMWWASDGNWIQSSHHVISLLKLAVITAPMLWRGNWAPCFLHMCVPFVGYVMLIAIA